MYINKDLYSKLLGLFLFCLIAALFSVFALVILQNFPNSADEYVYLFQAETYASARLYTSPPPDLDLFNFFYIMARDGKYFGQYPFGYPLLLALGVLVNAPWIINPILGALTIFLIYGIASILYSRRVAFFSVTLGTCTTFFIFNSSSYFSHTTCTLFLALMTYAYLKARQSKRIYWYIIIGLSAGYAFNTRYLESAITIVILGACLLKQYIDHPKKTMKPTLAVIGSGGIFLFIFFYYNYLLTGDPFSTPINYYQYGNEQAFFYSSLQGLKNGHGYFVEYMKGLLEWTYYAPLVIIPLFLPFRLRIPRFTYVLIAICFFQIMGYLFYIGGAVNQYGPRYYYGFYYILRILASYIIDQSIKFRSIQYLIIMLFVGLNINSLVEKSKEFQQQIFLRRDLFRTAEEACPEKCFIFLKSGSFSMPTMDLIRNGIELDGPIIYGHMASPEKRNKVLAQFPSHQPYSYQYDFQKNEGYIQPMVDLNSSITIQSSGFVPEVDQIGGLEGSYFNNVYLRGKPKHVRADSKIDFNWRYGMPYPNFTEDLFSVRWKGYIHIEQSKKYRFALGSDDGSMLFIGDHKIIDAWYDHAYKEEIAEVTLEKGWHKIEIRYFERYAHSKIKLSWDTGGSIKVIEDKYFAQPKKP